MAKIAFILLCHKDPEAIVQQANRLTATGDYMAIHFDARAPRAEYDVIRTAMADNPNVTLVRKRVKCGWGEWSLVDATLRAVRAAVDAFPRASHFYMVSGDCMAIKSSHYAHRFLDANDVDYIESFDYFASDWIKTGMKEERLIYRHFLNERKHKTAFYAAWHLQRKLGLTRQIPPDLQMMIGSQWWCLRRRTVEWVLDLVKKRRDIMRFFRRTWIPDETFFQTIVRHLVPENEIETRTLTFLMFTEYGMPVTFYNDHYDLLLSQDFLFARKISPEAQELKERLGDLWANDEAQFKISGEGRSLFKFLTGKGRIGRRFATRFWETESTLGRERELLIITSKKWHLAKRLIGRIKQVTDLSTVEYLFDEDDTYIPELGGIQSTRDKRTRHRRALLRMLFDYYKSDRMVVCIDPSNMELFRDFYADRCVTKLLEMECEFTEDYLIGHAKRVGLAGAQTPQETIDRIIPTIRHEFEFESDQIRDANFPHFYRLCQTASDEENTRQIAGFLSISEDAAREIAQTEYLFTD